MKCGKYAAPMLACAALLLGLCLTAADKRSSIAVSVKIIGDLQKQDRYLGSVIGSEMETALSNTQQFNVLSRYALGAVLNERKLAGDEDNGAGHADLLAVCSISRNGSVLTLTVKEIHNRSNQVRRAVTLTNIYQENNYKQTISEMALCAVQVLTTQDNVSFQSALQLIGKGKNVLGREIIRGVGVQFLPPEANSGKQLNHPDMQQEIRSPEEWFRMGWEAHRKGNLELASDCFLLCRKMLKINDFSELTRSAEVSQPHTDKPDFQTPWQPPEMTMVMIPVKAGKLHLPHLQAASPEVSMSAFWICAQEISIQDFRYFVEHSENSIRRKVRRGLNLRHLRCPFSEDFTLKDDCDLTQPMTCISWENAVLFAEWLNKRERQAHRLPKGYCYRLPTEYEWDFAARNVPVQIAAGKPNSAVKNMYGGVWEWCMDWYIPAYGVLPGKQLCKESFKNHLDSPGKVIRGGDASFPPDTDWRNLRNNKSYRSGFGNVGFRLVLAVKY